MAMGAIRACNDVLPQHNYTAGEYAYVPSNIEAVLKWDILLPSHFDPDSAEARKLLNDPPGGGFELV